MRTHLRIVVVGLAAALALPAAAQQERPPSAEMARLEARIAALEARVAALEAEEEGLRPGGKAIERVALLADRAISRLVDMVGDLKRDLKGERP
jgi:cell division protein FtsB